MTNIWQLETLCAGDLELIVLPGIGGRLWDIKFLGRSLLFQNSDLQGFMPNPTDLGSYPTRSPHFGFPLWGGEKTWIAPDINWTNQAPYPVLDSGPYDILDIGTGRITLKSAVCPHSRLQIERCINIKDGASWVIEHTVTNVGKTARDVGVWSVMMMDHKARIAVAGTELNVTPVFGNADEALVTKTAGLICDCGAQREFKVGIDNPSGRSFMRFGGDDITIWMTCDTARPEPTQAFAHSYPLEVFNSGDYPYCEAEWHSPLVQLKPRETMRFVQEFSIWSYPTNACPVTLTDPEVELVKCMS